MPSLRLPRQNTRSYINMQAQAQQPPHNQWNIIVLSFIALTLISFTVTWFFGFYLHLSWNHLLVVFSILLFLQRMLIQYFLPFQVIEQLVKNLSFLQIFGFAAIGLSSGFVNTWILSSRFGFIGSATLALGASLLGSGLVDAYFLLQPLISQT